MLRVAEATHVSDTGRHRKMNEDRWFVRAPLFGRRGRHGRRPAGEVASQIAIDVLEQGLPDGPGPRRGAPRRRWSSRPTRASTTPRASTPTAPGWARR
jgi:hypothetical protein